LPPLTRACGHAGSAAPELQRFGSCQTAIKRMSTRERRDQTEEEDKAQKVPSGARAAPCVQKRAGA